MADLSTQPPIPTRPPLPTRIVRLTDPGHRQPLDFDVQPDAAGLAAVAADLGIPAVRKLRLRGRLAPVGRLDWRLDAHLGATVVQECVVTLDPVVTRIDEPVERRYLADMMTPAPGPGGGEIEMPEDDAAEALPASVDLVGVMLEALALALPPYPRAPGAALGSVIASEAGVAPLTDEAARPFAGLRDALKGDG